MYARTSRRCRYDRLQIFALQITHTASDAGPRSGTDRTAAQRHFVGNSMEPDSPTRSLTSLHTNDILDDMLHWRFLEQDCQSELPHSNPGASQNGCNTGVGKGAVEAPREANLAGSHCTEPAIELLQRRQKGLPRATRRQKQNRQAQDRLRQRQKVVQPQVCPPSRAFISFRPDNARGL